jgi:RNA polymerase sigma factor (sigma-70 family)
MAAAEAPRAASRAVDDLYRQHRAEVYRYSYAVLGNHADAEDVTQTTFLNAYRALEQGVRPRKPSNWLLMIASNAIKQRFRQEQARPRQVELDERIASSERDDEGPSVGELLTALSKISPQQRQAIVLREFEGRAYGEIADILGTTTSALETLLFRARRSLAEELEHQLTCTEAQRAVSRAVDGRLGRKERRRLRDHLAECPDCARFARVQPRHRSALRGLMLIPIPLSLSLFKGLEGAGTATAATISVGAGEGAGTTAASTGVASGIGSAGTAGGSAVIGGVTLKAAAVVAAVTITGAIAVTGAVELGKIGNETSAAASTNGVPPVSGLHGAGAARDRVPTRDRVAATGALVETGRSASPNAQPGEPIERSGFGAASGPDSVQPDADMHPTQPRPESGKPQGSDPHGSDPQGDEPQGDEPQGDEPQGDEPPGSTPQSPENSPNPPQGSQLQVPTQTTALNPAPNRMKQPKKAGQPKQRPQPKPAKSATPPKAEQPPKPQQGPKPERAPNSQQGANQQEPKPENPPHGGQPQPEKEPPGQSKTEAAPAEDSPASSRPANENAGGSKR